jgi:hypothetical protein
MSDDRAVFTDRTRPFVAGVAILSFVATIAALVFGPQLASREAQPRDSYGGGPLGHRAFVETLDALGVRVTRWTRPRWDEVSAPLFLIEPNDRAIVVEDEYYDVGDIVRARMTADLVTVLVLPKWDPAMFGAVEPSSFRDLESLLESLPLHVELVYVDEDERFRWQSFTAREADGTARALELRAPRRITGGEPVLSDGAGSFVVSDDKHLLYVVSDPDLLHSFNLQRGDHAAFWSHFVRETLHADAITIDEVFHGTTATRSITELFASWPGVLALVHAAFMVIVLLAMGRKRFGPPDPIPEALGRGPREVIDVAASVLANGTRVPTLALRYVEDLVSDLHRRLALGEAKTDDERAQLVDAAAKRRDVAPRAVEILATARALESRRRAGEALALARDASFFRARMLRSASTESPPPKERPQ